MTQELESTFVQLVDASWEKHNASVKNRRMDDLLIGGVITTMVNDGHALIDIASDGTSHSLRFEDPSTNERRAFELRTVSTDLVTARVIGRHARVVVGYGEQVDNTGAVLKTLQSEAKSSFLDTNEPGVITADADLKTGYIYVQVPLLLDLDDYFPGGYEIDYERLDEHLEAAAYSLRKYLRGRLQS